MNYNAWANFSMSLYQVTLFYVSFTQLQQWTEFTMNDVEHYLMWTLWNYIIVNFTWILNDIWMDVKWFEWNFNKQFKEWNISSVIILLPSNPAQRLLWHSVEFNQCPDALWQYSRSNWIMISVRMSYSFSSFRWSFERDRNIWEIGSVTKRATDNKTESGSNSKR